MAPTFLGQIVQQSQDRAGQLYWSPAERAGVEGQECCCPLHLSLVPPSAFWSILPVTSGPQSTALPLSHSPDLSGSPSPVLVLDPGRALSWSS